jgi:hypothetical protein
MRLQVELWGMNCSPSIPSFDDEGFESLGDLFLLPIGHPGIDKFYPPPLLIASRRPGTRKRS